MKTQFKNALVSVSDKTGLVDFLMPLYQKGLRVVSTGGTAKVLREAGMDVVDVSEQTGFPECMDGRVKTLHPRIHMPLLSRHGNKEDEELLKQEELAPFDLVIVNLYPFEQSLKSKASQEELIENIDIGGPSLLRGAAKNFERMTVVVDPDDYSTLLAFSEGVPKSERQRLAAKAFVHVSSYDAMISQALAPEEHFAQFSLGGTLVQELRYGENPHQKARWYRRRGAPTGTHEARILQGKELSYNNLLDIESALGLVCEFDAPAAVAVKHNSPCGAACAVNLETAVDRCMASDPVSVFGGIVAVNHGVSGSAADALAQVFLECIIAPKFTPEALAVLSKKKNLRVLEWPGMAMRDHFWRLQTIQGGFLLQQPDKVKMWDPMWKILGPQPSPDERADLSFAWAVCAHLKSNAIAIVSEKQTLGLGMGQVNRVDAVELACARQKKFHRDAQVLVLASDAFFPFPDSIELIHKAGIRWVIQPGGSVRDHEVIEAAKDFGIHMVLTGQRHFRH